MIVLMGHRHDVDGHFAHKSWHRSSRDKWTFYLEDAIERLEMKEHQKEIASWNV